MGRIGDGYGSECHLLRWMGRHRADLDREVLAAVGARAIQWLDFPFKRTNPWPDAEWKGVDFTDDDGLIRDWENYWPSGRGIQNWDAVAEITTDGGAVEWLLVEAKAHRDELRAACRASDPNSLGMIRKAFAETRLLFGVQNAGDWMKPYYQYANRLAAVSFFHPKSIASTSRPPTRQARLLLLYFYGDWQRPGWAAPQNDADWEQHLDPMYAHIGVTPGAEPTGLVHKLFLPVAR